MKKLIYRSINTFSLVIVLAISAAAQTPSPTPERSVQTIAAPKSISLAALPAGEKFTSAEGRFTISAPKNGAEFEKIVPSEDSPGDTGERYSWTLKEGIITVEYNDDPDFQIKTAKDYADMAEGMRAGISVFNGTVTSEKVIKSGIYRGYEISFDDPSSLKGISRMLIAGNRRYTVFYLTLPGYSGGPELAIKAMDSFKVTAAKAAPKKPVKKATKGTRKN